MWQRTIRLLEHGVKVRIGVMCCLFVCLVVCLFVCLLLRRFLWRTSSHSCLGASQPVYVFDGKPPTLKSGELAQRKKKKEDATEAAQAANEEGNQEEGAAVGGGGVFFALPCFARSSS